MALSFKFFADPALTTPLLGSLAFVQESAGPVAADCVLYFGSRAVGKVLQAISNPGVDNIVLSIADAAPAGGSPAASVKLALSAGGLDTAVGGAALALGAELLSGLDNALAIHVRVLDSTGVAGVNSDLSVSMNAVGEFSV